MRCFDESGRVCSTSRMARSGINKSKTLISRRGFGTTVSVAARKRLRCKRFVANVKDWLGETNNLETSLCQMPWFKRGFQGTSLVGKLWDHVRSSFLGHLGFSPSWLVQGRPSFLFSHLFLASDPEEHLIKSLLTKNTDSTV